MNNRMPYSNFVIRKVCFMDLFVIRKAVFLYKPRGPLLTHFTKYELRKRMDQQGRVYELRITPIEARADFRNFREVISLYLRLPNNGVKIPRCTTHHPSINVVEARRATRIRSPRVESFSIALLYLSGLYA